MLWRCTCGGVLDLAGAVSDQLVAECSPAGLWRYRPTLPGIADENLVTLGEGMTPLVDARHSAGIVYKLEYLFPTGSFKDRGSTVLASCLKALGIARAVEDSSGNAGASMAAYFAAAGIEATIFVPATTSPAKTSQIRAFGARLVPVTGTRDDVTYAAQETSADGFYTSHLWSPYFLAGTMTFAFELWEQLGQRLPDRVILPVGGGTLLLGAYLGFRHLVAIGAADHLPSIIGVQAKRFAPLSYAFEAKCASTLGATIPEGETLAEGIRLRHPPRGHQILRAVRETGGRIETVTETEIRHAWRTLAHQGLYVEPTGAVAAAAAQRLVATENLSPDAITIAALTGSGLKGVTGMFDDGTAVPAGKE
ncbi:MAG: threonine synthase [Thermomicrobiales bacterium]|jgi:threonine synthase|nr:threonine synthase [Thermomicrobiales bacterium]